MMLQISQMPEYQRGFQAFYGLSERRKSKFRKRVKRKYDQQMQYGFYSARVGYLPFFYTRTTAVYSIGFIAAANEVLAESAETVKMGVYYSSENPKPVEALGLPLLSMWVSAN